MKFFLRRCYLQQRLKHVQLFSKQLVSLSFISCHLAATLIHEHRLWQLRKQELKLMAVLAFLARSCLLFLISAGTVVWALSVTCCKDPTKLFPRNIVWVSSPCEVSVIAFILQPVPKSNLWWHYFDSQHLDLVYSLTKLFGVHSVHSAQCARSVHNIIGIVRVFIFHCVLYKYTVTVSP